MDVKTKAITQAARLLTAAGAQFKIIAPDGAEFGDLEVAEPKARATRRHNVYAVTGYIQKIDAMAVGDVVTLEPPTPEDLDGFRSAVCGSAGRAFGNGNYTTATNAGAVEVLRIA